MVRGRILIGVGETEQRLFPKQFSRQPQAGRRAPVKSIGQTEFRMAGQVGQRYMAPDEQVEITQGVVYRLNESHTQTIGL